MQACVKCKAYRDKKTIASKLNVAHFVYVLQPKADHQGSKLPSTEFEKIWPYIVEKPLANDKYLVRKWGETKRFIA